MLPASLAVGCWLATGRGVPDACRWGAVAVVAVALIAVEQLNITDNFRKLDRSQVLAALDAVGEPPAECTTFDLEPRPDRNPDYASIDAMLVAQRTGVPTVNGYSGWQPEGWTLMPGSPAYAENVDAWVARHGLGAGHCTLHAATGTWTGP